MAAPLIDGGDHGLETVVENENADIDIIAVHGLGADPTHAWRLQEEVNGRKTGNNFNWLKDQGMLPTEIPSARILAFNYKSNWHKDGTSISVWALGEELMREISVDREKNEKARQRPIVFIGHSFGGIVIEQGIVSANYDTSPHKPIVQCTVGIALLGTPHVGSESAVWGTQIARISEISGLGGDKSLIETLQKSSPVLENIIHHFVIWVQNSDVELVQFYEIEKTNYGTALFRWNELVVPKSSACLTGYTSIPLPSNHLKMAKFNGPHNECYKKIKPVIEGMVKAAPDKIKLRFEPRAFIQDNSQIPAVHLECQKALFISWPESELKGIKRRLGKRTTDTCEWLLAKKQYNEWFSGDRPQVLRLVGEPGMGKSMIITFLIEQLITKLGVTKNMVLAYHFCDNRNQSSNNACAVVRQMLFQLFQQRPAHFGILQKAYDVDGPKLFQNFDKMWVIFLEVITQFGEGEVFILLDALDECDEESRQYIMQGLHEVSEGKYNVRIFFTCRPEADIEQFQKTNIGTVDVRAGKEDIKRDLERFMADKVPAICLAHGWDKEAEDLISRELVARADGIFLWCAFVLEDIDKVKRKSKIKEALDKLPRNLQQVYQRITGAFADDEAARMVLEVVGGARRPLKKDELALTYVLAIDSPDNWDSDEIPPEKELKEHDDAYECCGRLLRYDEPTNTVNLVHQSAKDYLLSEYLIKDMPRPKVENKFNKMDKGVEKANMQISNVRLNNLFLEIIFRYYRLSTFDHLSHRMVFDAEWDIDWECSWWEMEPSPAFMIYAGREWELHCKDAETHARQDKTSGMSRFNRFIRMSTKNSWLRRAAMDGNQKFLKWLLESEHPADRDSANFRGWTSLQLAAKYGQKNIIEYLVNDKKANINAEPPHIDGRTPIQTAAEENKQDIVELLLSLGADINNLPAKINGRTALQAAAEKANIETLKFLLGRKELDPNVSGAWVSGVTALLAGAGSGGEWQMGKNIHRTIKQRSRLPGSAEIDTKKIAEEDQQDRNQRQKEENDHEEVVKLLVQTPGVNVQLIPNQFNWTALHAAVERESDRMVGYILSIPHVDCNVKGNHDGTPLHSAKAKANEELATRLEQKGGTDLCPYSKLDLDAMMKYIRAVLTRLMIKSNTERFFFIQSYIPIYHVVYSYCAEGADDQNDNPPVEQGGRRGELVYRDVDAWLKSYVMWNQKFIFDTPAKNDFLTVYLREWKLFKRGAYYVGRMLRYLTRHWVKHQREELKHKDVKDIADLFFHRWRAGMTGEMRARIKTLMNVVSEGIDAMEHKDTRVLDAVNESLNGPFSNFKDIFQGAQEYFRGFKSLAWDKDKDFEVTLRDLTDEFEVESEVWTQNAPQEKKEQVKRNAKRKELLRFEEDDLGTQLWTPEAADFYLNTVEKHFLAPYSGGRTAEIKKDIDQLWDMLRKDDDEAKKRAENRERNLRVVNANADHEINGVYADGEDTYMANGIQQTPLNDATEATA